MMGYHAIGSGLPHAMFTFIARNCNQDMSLEDVLLITYEAKKMAERAPGVGANITDPCIMNSSKTYLSKEEDIKELDSIYRKWIKSNDEGRAETSEFLKKVGFKNDGKAL